MDTNFRHTQYDDCSGTPIISQARPSYSKREFGLEDLACETTTYILMQKAE